MAISTTGLIEGVRLLFTSFGRLLSLLVIVGLSAPSIEAKTAEEYWMETGLKLTDVAINNKACNVSEKEFVACIHGLNAILAFQEPSQLLVPASRLKAETGFGSPILDFGVMVTVAPKKANTDDFAEIYKMVRAEKALSAKAEAELFKNRDTTPVDFQKIFDALLNVPAVLDKESVVAGAVINAMLTVQEDPHTRILPKASMEDDNTAGNKNFVGIGAIIKAVKKGEKTSLVIQQPFESGPAYKAGVRANDVITHVDGNSVEGKDLDAVIATIKGPKDSEVTLTLNRAGAALDITIVRGLIEVKNVTSKMIGGQSEVGYVKLSDFMQRDKDGNTMVYTESKAGLESVIKNSPKGLIFDLRDNGGGLLTEAIRISSLFLKPGSLVVSTKSVNDDNVRVFNTSLKKSERPVSETLPLVVLINARSASASELVAGALQDHQRAFLVGERSFGKGTVQGVMQDRTNPKLYRAQTIERFYQPSGRTNQVASILPDLEVFSTPNPTEADKVAFREEDEYAALPAVGSTWTQPRPDAVKQLETCVAKGKAKELFEADEKAGLGGDYQLAVAIDAVNCIADEKIWTADMPAPVFKAPRATSFLDRLFGPSN